MIGPFPIIFGTDTGSVKALILLSILLMVTVLAFLSMRVRLTTASGW